MSTDTPRPQESTGTITGPHDGTDRDGDLDHRYWRCRRCGLESTDPRLREGCFRCGSPARERVDRGDDRNRREQHSPAEQRNPAECRDSGDRDEVERG